MHYVKEPNFLTQNPLFTESNPGKALKANPLGFIDIGARGGVHLIVDALAKYTSVLAFEPDLEECERLRKDKHIAEHWSEFLLYPVALSNQQGEASLKLLSSDTNHSLLSPNSDFVDRYNMVKWKEIGQCPLMTDTLDHVLFNELADHSNCGEFLKIDTQGTEYEILEGAKRTLTERTVAVVCEVSFCELYKNQKLFSDVESFLRQYGFSFYGFPLFHHRSCKYLSKEQYATRERAFYGDAVFFKDPFHPSKNIKLSERQSYTLFTCALLLGYYDFALELAKKNWVKNPEEETRIQSLIQQCAITEPQEAVVAVRALLNQVSQSPEEANVIVGSFVDQRRHLCDYNDVMNVSPLPRVI